MADLAVAASEVQQGAGAIVRRYVAAVAVAAGQSVALDANKQAVLADANLEATAVARGVAVNSAAAGQTVAVQEDGELDLGATAAAASGVVYVVSATAGGIAPVSDLGSSEYTTVLGVGTGSGKVAMGRTVGGAIA